MTTTKTFENEELLPKLPLPSLDETCQTYLQSVRPLVDDEAYKLTCENVEDFKKTCGHLQSKLEERSELKGNWVRIFDFNIIFGSLNVCFLSWKNIGSNMAT